MPRNRPLSRQYRISQQFTGLTLFGFLIALALIPIFSPIVGQAKP